MPNDDLLYRLLSHVTVLDQFTATEARLLVSCCAKRSATVGEQLIEQGSHGREMFILLSGHVEVRRESPDGCHHLLATLGPGDCFGELALLDYDTRSASVICSSEALLLSLDRAVLTKAPDIAPKLYRNLAKLMAQRLRQTDDLVNVLVNCPSTIIPIESRVIRNRG